MDKKLIEIKEKLESGERLAKEDGISLYLTDDILTLGEMAVQKKREKSQNKIYFSTNLNINHTNICEHSCPLCAFSKKDGENGSYKMNIESILNSMDNLPESELLEVHIVGGLNKNYDLNFFKKLFEKIKKSRENIFIQALTAVEIEFISKIEGVDFKTVLSELKKSGLDSIPGGGAEIFSDRVRKIIAPDKISGSLWLEIMEVAHSLDIPTNATMLYGHVETIEERIEHMLALRELQDRSGGFKCFVPLSFHSGNTEFKDIPSTTGYDDLKTYAISRLILDNFEHIKGLWMYLGLSMAQISLSFGVDDMGGTSIKEKIVHAAGATTPDRGDSEILIDIIRESGFTPYNSDSAYIREKQC